MFFEMALWKRLVLMSMVKPDNEFFLKVSESEI